MTLPTVLVIICAGHGIYRSYLRSIDTVDAYVFYYLRLYIQSYVYILYDISV